MTDRVYPFDELLLAWRRASGDRRVIVGRITIDEELTPHFEYLQEGVREAERTGFTDYPGLPHDKMVNQETARDLFYRRLINTERNDAGRLLDFLRVDANRRDDKLYMLGITGGHSATDNFEFLPLLKPLAHAYEYVTEIAGVSHHKPDLSKIKVGDELTATPDTLNKYDPQAVALHSADGALLGYVKQGIKNIFHCGSRVRVFVHHIIDTTPNQSVFIRLEIAPEGSTD